MTAYYESKTSTRWQILIRYEEKIVTMRLMLLKRL